MSTRAAQFVSGEYYHIYNRGNSRQNIFRHSRDYERFMALLFLSNSIHSFNIKNLGVKNPFDTDREKQLVNILAYCLMPNHFHILLTPLEDINASAFMLKLGTGYSMFFNKKYNRTGSLFEGSFKSRHVHEDTYFRYLFAYIHLNPLKLIDSHWKDHGLRDRDEALSHITSYRYSSLPEYLISRGEPSRKARKEDGIVDKDLYSDIFEKEETTLAELDDWMLEYQPFL